MMISIRLIKKGEDERSVHYAVEDQVADPPLAGEIALSKSGLPDPPPPVVRLTLDWYQPPSATPQGDVPSDSGATARAKLASRIQPATRAVVVKSRVSGPKHPPEWLEQFIGKTGVVLWTTHEGAMLDFDGKATWFAFDELEPTD
jgi:hypothetical protein